MTPREFDAIIAGLHEYRAEEHRAAQKVLAGSGQQTIGGAPIHN